MDTREEGKEPVSKAQIPLWRYLAGSRGTRRQNLSRETQLSGANGDKETTFFCSADHEQGWQSYRE